MAPGDDVGPSRPREVGVDPCAWARRRSCFAADGQAVWYDVEGGTDGAMERRGRPLERSRSKGIEATVRSRAAEPRLFGIREGDRLTTPGRARALGAWEDWTALGRPAGRTRDGACPDHQRWRAGDFAVGGDGAVHHRWQDKPLGRVASVGVARRVRRGAFTVAKSPTGGLAIFAVGTDDAVRYRYQPAPFGAVEPLDLDLVRTCPASLTAQASYTDGLEVFAIGLDDEVYHKWCERVGCALDGLDAAGLRALAVPCALWRVPRSTAPSTSRT